MKRIVFLFVAFLSVLNIFPQNTMAYETGIMGEKNMQAIANLSPYTSATGFDNRYQGLKGSTLLFDTLTASSLLIEGQDDYIQLRSDIDLVKNTMIFVSPSTRKLMEISSDHIVELVFFKNGKKIVFRTSKGIDIEKDTKENKFYQVLNERPYQFIKIPEKKFVEADYKRPYSSDIRYDEFKPVNKYYMEGSDSIFHRVQLNKKSLIKLFPDKKELIEKDFEGKIEGDAEEQVISILEHF